MDTTELNPNNQALAQVVPPQASPQHLTNEDAKKYIESRKLNPTLFPSFRLKYQYIDKTEEKPNGERWPLLEITDSQGNQWSRVIGGYSGSNKTRNAYGSKPTQLIFVPHQIFDYSKTIWIVEGILDAYSLIQSGKQAVAVYGAGYNHIENPQLKSFVSNFDNVMIAFDNDEAGRNGSYKLFLALESFGVKSISYATPETNDWNDLLNSQDTTDIFPIVPQEQLNQSIQPDKLETIIRIATDKQKAILNPPTHLSTQYAGNDNLIELLSEYAGTMGGFDDRTEWIKLGYALKREGYQLQDFINLSYSDHDTQKACKELWKDSSGASSHGANMGTLTYWARIINPEFRKKRNDFDTNKDSQVQDVEKTPTQKRNIEAKVQARKNIVVTEKSILATGKEPIQWVEDISTLEVLHMFSMIQAGTASGKTEKAVNEFIQCIIANQKVAYVAQQKEDQNQFKSRLEKKLDELGLNVDDKILNLQAGEKLEDELGEQTILKDYQFIITHHTYLGRKGATNAFFSFLKWCEGAVVMVDEIDSLMKSLVKITPLGTRAIKKEGKAKTRTGKRNVSFSTRGACPANNMSSGRSVSVSCIKCIGCEKPLYSEKDGVFEIKQKSYFDSESIFKQQTDYEIDKESIHSRILGTKRNGNMIVKQLSNNIPVEIDLELVVDEEPDLNDYLQDTIDYSLNPSIRSFEPLKEGDVVGRDELIQVQEEYRKASEYHKKNKSDKSKDRLEKAVTEKRKYQLPNGLCGTEYLHIQDYKSLFILRDTVKQLIVFSATTTTQQLLALKKIFPNFIHYKQEQTRMKMDNFLLIGTTASFSEVGELNGVKKELSALQDIEFIQDNETKKVQTILFSGSGKKSEHLYNRMKEKDPTFKVMLDQGGDMHHVEQVAQQKSKTPKGLISNLMLTHAGSRHGRSMDMKEYQLGIVDMTTYLPQLVAPFDFNEENEEQREIKFKTALDEIRLNTAIQNAGRVHRGTGRKVNILYNCTEDDFKALADLWSSKASLFVSKWYEKDIIASLKTARCFLDNGDVKSFNTLQDKFKKSSTNSLSKKQRKQVTPEMKVQAKREKREATLNSLVELGLNEKQIKRKIHFDRLNEQEKEYYQQFIYDLLR